MEFTEAQKRCFAWQRPDGTPAFADPLLTYRHLMALFEGDYDRVAGEVNGQDASLKFQATRQVAWAVCEAFELAPFDSATGEGTPADFCLDLLRRFMLWRAEQKKNGETTPATSSAG